MIRWGTASPEKIAVRKELLKELGADLKGLGKIQREQILHEKTFKKALSSLELEAKIDVPKIESALWKMSGDYDLAFFTEDFQRIRNLDEQLKNLYKIKLKHLYRVLDHAKNAPGISEIERKENVKSLAGEIRYLIKCKKEVFE
ncbi:MAG: hypothetical protein HYW05_05065 [Candidatus Diapherotrites archaeon]|nr:hypothetical protein [Candidatus Diapherotrites archaeon]